MLIAGLRSSLQLSSSFSHLLSSPLRPITIRIVLLNLHLLLFNGVYQAIRPFLSPSFLMEIIGYGLGFIPFYILNVVINSVFYTEVMAIVMARPRPTSPIQVLAGNIIFCGLQVLLMIQTWGWLWVPYIGWVLSWGLSAFLNSVYIFNFGWVGWTYAQKKKFVDQYWLYLIGFGMPITLMTMVCSWVVGTGLYGLLFPVLMMRAMVTQPVAGDYRFRVLDGLERIVNFLLRRWTRKKSYRK